PASGTVGDTFKDNTKLERRVGAHAGGTVSFKLFNNKSCDASEGGLIASDGPVAVDGNGEYATPHGASPTQAGTYYWVATYSGDPNNKEAVSGCADEPDKIDPATPKVETTQDPASGTVGDTFKDNAKLSGLFGAHAGGTVSFKLFNNKSCDASHYTTKRTCLSCAPAAGTHSSKLPNNTSCDASESCLIASYCPVAVDTNA